VLCYTPKCKGVKVLILNSIGRRKWGGGEKWMILAAQGLKSRGHSVFIGCRRQSVIEKEAAKCELSVVNIDIRCDVSLIGAYQLVSFKRQYGIDVIIGCQNRDVRTAGMVRALLGYPLIISRQGVKLIHRSWKHRLTFTRWCDGIITNTQSIKQEYDRYGWWDRDFVEVIHNGVDLPAAEKGHLQLRNYLPYRVENPFLILSAGRLAHQKGFHYLVKAAQQVCAVHSNVFFFIAGDGKLEKMLQRQIDEAGLQNRVFLIGFQSHLADLLTQSNLFVLSSVYEGMPNVVMEAMMSRVPVVTTRVNGVEELMRDNIDGQIVSAANSNELADAIKRMIDSPERDTIVESAYRRVKDHFSVDHMVDHLEKYLHSKLKRKAPSSCLIIQTAFIGDVVLATSVVETIKKSFPECHVDFLLRKGNEGLLDRNPLIRQTLVFDKTQGKYRNLFGIIGQIRQNKYDQVINIQRYATTGLITALSGARVKVGFAKNPLSPCFNLRIAHKMQAFNQNMHEIERNHQLIGHLTRLSAQRPRLYPAASDFQMVKTDAPYFCLAPTSVWFTKQFSYVKWIELINRLPVTHTIYLMGGKGDFAICEKMRMESTHPHIVNKSGALSFLQSAALMAGAQMNFVNDSAPLHFASAMNAPVRALFCSTVPAFGYTPLSDDSMVIETDHELTCRPCGLHGKRSCPKGHFRCGDISIDRILRLSNID
jgi:ADP-heptose:LPS heptosyltransferase/glycosyltransferase involved in cell wall biosynthesis